MALLSEIEKPTTLPPLPKRFNHHVLFSYASEDAEYVRAVHAALRALSEEVKAFDYAEDGMWGEELVEGIERRYKNEAPFCVVFLSKAYLASSWTTKELGIVSRVAKQKPGYMLPVLLDGTTVPEIEGIVWLDKSLTPEELAARLFAKIQAPPPKPWWFYVSFKVKVAIAAVVFALILSVRPAMNAILPSNTTVLSAKATDVITARIVNSGPKSSTIVRQRLKFGALPIEDAELQLDKPTSATIAHGEHHVKLIALGLETKCDDEGNRPNNEQVRELLGQQPVTLEIDIRESDDAPGQSTRQVVKLSAAQLKQLIEKGVANDANPCN